MDVVITEKKSVDLNEVVRRAPFMEIITPELWRDWQLPPSCKWPWIWNSRGGYLEIVFPVASNDYEVEVIAQLKTFERGPYGRIWMDRSMPEYYATTGTLWEGDVPSIPSGMLLIEQALDAWGCWGSPDAIKWFPPSNNPFTPDRPMSPLKMNITRRIPA